MKTSAQLLSALTLTLALGGCSTPSAESLAQNDPWEKTNRDIFEFDVRLDHAVARPVARGYRDVVPEPVRDGIHNALTNLNSPVVLANDVLQGDGDKAVNTFGRIVINSTVGVAGFIDVASKIGIPGAIETDQLESPLPHFFQSAREILNRDQRDKLESARRGFGEHSGRLRAVPGGGHDGLDGEGSS